MLSQIDYDSLIDDFESQKKLSKKF